MELVDPLEMSSAHGNSTARSDLGGSGWYINRTQLNGRKTRLIIVTYYIYIYTHYNISIYTPTYLHIATSRHETQLLLHPTSNKTDSQQLKTI